MRCPACEAPLLAIEYDEVEVDYCTECRGIWLDAGELELLFGDGAHVQEFLRGGVDAPGRESARKCPICRTTMGKQRTRGGEEILYDQCPNGHGLWLDDGELSAIMRHAPEHAGGADVHRFLRAVFGAADARE